MKQLSHFINNRILVGVGANIAGTWGEPKATITRCFKELETLGFKRLASSSPYCTKPVGFRAQPDFTNLVLEMSCDHMPRNILKLFKLLEQMSGRRNGPRNSPRPLDLDLLAYRDWVVNWPPPRHRPRIILPHPFLTERAFVLVPLAEVAPAWRHPVTGLTARRMLADLGGARRLERVARIERLDYGFDL